VVLDLLKADGMSVPSHLTLLDLTAPVSRADRDSAGSSQPVLLRHLPRSRHPTFELVYHTHSSHFTCPTHPGLTPRCAREREINFAGQSTSRQAAVDHTSRTTTARF
jgi:hypothetical protein